MLEAAGSMLVVSPLADVEDEALCPRPRPYVPSSVVIKEHEHEHVVTSHRHLRRAWHTLKVGLKLGLDRCHPFRCVRDIQEDQTVAWTWPWPFAPVSDVVVRYRVVDTDFSVSRTAGGRQKRERHGPEATRRFRNAPESSTSF